ncbi:tyrosine-type recombinase/integrase [Clostridium saccharoperbutylacetonicum]|uniref:tyrosine-type recombinase/integrase n=1 Tax=Clostridium saccharoperbutylacetonicum TaxID=36745 RepID=UPI0039EC4132
MGELVNINLNDLNFNDQTLLINGKVRKERLLYISSSDVIDALKTWINSRDSLAPKGDALFINKYGITSIRCMTCF